MIVKGLRQAACLEVVTMLTAQARMDLPAVLSCLILYLVLQLDCALTSLPAPVNISVDSVNFRHILRWDPGLGTPQGTKYRIRKKVTGKNWRLLPNTTTSVAIELKLEPFKRYDLAVQASYNKTLSEWSSVNFYPCTDTTIGPPAVSMVGCGACVQINISLPDADKKSKIKNMHTRYDPQFRVLWKKGKEGKQEELKTHNRTVILRNLEKGVEYCAQVHIKIRTNKNTMPSGWFCHFSSPPELRNSSKFIGAATGVLIPVLMLLMMTLFSLYYAGFLCKPKEVKPGALVVVLINNYTLTPDRCASNQISIISELENQRKPPVSRISDSEEDSEDEENSQVMAYMDRIPDLSDAESSHQESCHVNTSHTIAEDSGNLMESLSGPQTGSFHDNSEEKELQLSVLQNGSQARVQGQVISVEEETQEVCSNINLFSVTLLSLAAEEEDEKEEEEEEEESEDSDWLKYPTSDSESRSEEWTTRFKPTKMPSDFSKNSYKTVHIWGEPKEEDGEEEISGYLGHES